MSGAGFPWWTEPASAAGAALLLAVGHTWRRDEANDPDYERGMAAGERFVYAFWHPRLLVPVFTRRDEGVAVLVSRHRDGQLITRVIERLGFVTARGSSTRGGEAGVREMIAWADKGRHLAVTPDGPRGPAGHVKEGVVFLAARLGRRVVPIGFSAAPALRLRSWDRFRVPLPFCRISITHGAPIGVAAGDAAQVETSRARVEAALHELTARVDGRSGARP